MQLGDFRQARSLDIDDGDVCPITSDGRAHYVERGRDVYGVIVKAEGSGERLRKARIALEYNYREGLHTSPKFNRCSRCGGGCGHRFYRETEIADDYE